MLSEPNDLEIHVHLAGGEVHSYFEDTPKHVKELLGHARSGNLFQQPSLVFASSKSVAAYHPPSVWRVDVIPSPASDWLNGPDSRGVDLRELRAPDFYELAEGNGYTDRPSRYPPPTPHSFFALLEIGTPCDDQMFLEVRGSAAGPSEQRQVLQHLFTLPILRCRRTGGGTALLNPSIFTHCTFRLDLPLVPITAWHAERICS